MNIGGFENRQVLYSVFGSRPHINIVLTPSLPPCCLPGRWRCLLARPSEPPCPPACLIGQLPSATSSPLTPAHRHRCPEGRRLLLGQPLGVASTDAHRPATSAPRAATLDRHHRQPGPDVHNPSADLDAAVNSGEVSILSNFVF
jgi:hypothetical protein